MATKAKLTYADYMASPDGDHHRWEVIDDGWARTPFPGTNHQLVVGELLMAVANYLDGRRQSSECFTYLAIILGPHDMYEPDVMVLTAQQLREAPDDEHPRGVPQLCVEVIEDATRTQDRGIKRERYAHFGVPEYWIVDWEEETVEVYVLEDGAYTKLCAAREADMIPSRALPGIELQPAMLFKDISFWLRSAQGT
ncbi:MAG: Uma2 family endonuclease [Thermomicrobiales bacterium]